MNTPSKKDFRRKTLTGMTMEMGLSHTKNEYTFLTTRNFVKILSVNTTILLLLDILDDTRPKNSLLETTGGHISKVPFDDISTNVNHAKEKETIEKNRTTRFTHMLFPRNPGNKALPASTLIPVGPNMDYRSRSSVIEVPNSLLNS